MKNKRILVVLIILIIMGVVGFQIYQKFSNEKSLKEEIKISEEIEKKEKVEDNNKPILKLKISNYQTFPKNTKIDYKNLIEIAKDKEDGNLINKVKWNQVDNTIINQEQVIIYDVSDNSGNQAIVSLTVVFTDTEIELPIDNNFTTIDDH